MRRRRKLLRRLENTASFISLILAMMIIGACAQSFDYNKHYGTEYGTFLTVVTIICLMWVVFWFYAQEKDTGRRKRRGKRRSSSPNK